MVPRKPVSEFHMGNTGLHVVRAVEMDVDKYQRFLSGDRISEKMKYMSRLFAIAIILCSIPAVYVFIEQVRSSQLAFAPIYLAPIICILAAFYLDMFAKGYGLEEMERMLKIKFESSSADVFAFNEKHGMAFDKSTNNLLILAPKMDSKREMDEECIHIEDIRLCEIITTTKQVEAVETRRRDSKPTQGKSSSKNLTKYTVGGAMVGGPVGALIGAALGSTLDGASGREADSYEYVDVMKNETTGVYLKIGLSNQEERQYPVHPLASFTADSIEQHGTGWYEKATCLKNAINEILLERKIKRKIEKRGIMLEPNDEN